MPAAFGVPQLDQALGDVEGNLLLRCDPGTEGLPFLFHALHQWVGQGRTVVYAAVDRAPEHVRRDVQGFGFGQEAAGDRVVFVDAHSPRYGSRSDAEAHVDNLRDPEAMADALTKAAMRHRDALLVVDSLSTVLSENADAAGPMMKAFDAFAGVVALHMEWGADDELAPMLRSFPSIVRLRAVVDRVITNQYFEVERSPEATNNRPILFRVGRPGGVFVYIPKIVVTGPFDAGKTRFVHAVSDEAVSAERRGTTIAMDRGHVTMKGLATEVFGTPGQERFDPLLNTLTAQAVGAVLVVDSTAPETFERARTILERIRRKGLRVVVAANKQDQPGAMTPEEVLAGLQLPEPAPVIPCRADDPESARHVLSVLIERILEGAP